MGYLIAQMLLCLLLAALLGFILGWLLKRCSCTEVEAEWQGRYSKLEDERNRLQLQLASSRRTDFDADNAVDVSGGAGSPGGD